MTRTIIFLLVFLGFLTCLTIPVSASVANTGIVTESHHGECSTVAKVFAILISIIPALVAFLIGWAIFPYTIAPITYLMQSELAIWGARLSMALAFGFFGFIFPFGFLTRIFSS